MSSYEIDDFFKNTFFKRTPPMAASELFKFTMVSSNAYTCKWINSIDAFPSHTTWHGFAIIDIFTAIVTCKTWITDTLVTISCWRAVSLDARRGIAKVWTNFTIPATEGRSKNGKMLINSATGRCSWTTMFCQKKYSLLFHWRTKLHFFPCTYLKVKLWRQFPLLTYVSPPKRKFSYQEN